MTQPALPAWPCNTDEEIARRGRQAQLALGLLATLFAGTMFVADRADLIALLPWMIVIAAPLLHVWMRVRSAKKP